MLSQPARDVILCTVHYCYGGCCESRDIFFNFDKKEWFFRCFGLICLTVKIHQKPSN